MYRYFIILAFSALSAFSSTAQLVNVTGVVRSKATNEPLPGVTVIADDSSGTNTDDKGYFSLDLSASQHLLKFRLVGFEEFSHKVILKEKTNEIIVIQLNEAIKELGLVVVTAGKHEQKIEEVTVSMEVIKPSLITNTNAFSMENVVDQVPGVNIIDGQANIRGGAGWSYGAGSRVLVLVDDIPQLSADANDAKWSFIPTENVEQVEVIKGASSVLFGSSALNGVINFRTAYPKAKPETQIIFHSGIYDKPVLHLGDSSYNLKWWDGLQHVSGLSFFHSRQVNQLDVAAGGNIFIDDGYREGEYENRARFNVNTRYRTKKEGLSFGANINAQIAEGNLFFIWQNDTSGSYFPANNTLSNYTNKKLSFDPYLTYFNKRKGVHKLRTRFLNVNNENNTDQNSVSDLYYAEYQFQQKLYNEKIILTSGLAEQYSKVKSELYSNHTGNNIAAYLQADATFNKLILSAGGRVEQNNVDNDSYDPVAVFRAGINYHLLNHTFLRASAGQGYRFPSIAERFIKTTVGGLGIYPNDSLDSETGFSVELGIKQGLKLGRWKGYLDLAAFINRYNNMMEFAFSNWGNPFVDPFFGLGFSSVNVGNTEIKGLEFTAVGNGMIAGNTSLELLAGYTFINPRQLTYNAYYIEKVGEENAMGSDSSNFLKYRYSHIARIDASFTRHKFSWGLSARYNSFMVNIDKFFVNELGNYFAPGIGHYRQNRQNGDIVADARLGYQFTPELKATFICKNLFNYIHMQRPADMQPPRIFTLQLILSL